MFNYLDYLFFKKLTNLCTGQGEGRGHTVVVAYNAGVTIQIF